MQLDASFVRQLNLKLLKGFANEAAWCEPKQEGFWLPLGVALAKLLMDFSWHWFTIVQSFFQLFICQMERGLNSYQ